MVHAFAVIGAFTSLLSAQNKGVINPHYVPPSMMYHRVWAVTPLQGSGTAGNPWRPLFVPATPAVSNDRSGLLGYQMWLSDDGKSALTEMVFATPATFQSVLQGEASSRGIRVAAPAPSAPGSVSSPGPSAVQTALESAIPGLKMFERGRATQDDVLTEFKKHKQDFQFGPFTVRVQ
jgi:hypothetical protein